MASVGDTFLWDPDGGNNPHLWIVLTTPEKGTGRCVIINLTTSSHGTHSVTLRVGDHPFIRHDSDVNFGDSMFTTEQMIQGAVASGNAVPKDPMSPNILKTIAEATKTHCAAAREIRKSVAAAWLT
jgi:hypothetical protein